MFVRSQNRKELVEITGMVISVHGQNIHAVGRATVQIAAYENEEKKLYAVQYHPEACPGPQDSGYLFDRFLKMMEVND